MQKVTPRRQKYVMKSKVRHDVKKYVMSLKVCYDVQ